ncbi:hypothetical protein R6Q59_015547 [Mikania micrantha]
MSTFDHYSLKYKRKQSGVSTDTECKLEENITKKRNRNAFVDYLIQTKHPSGRQIKKAKIHRLDEVNNAQKNQLNDLRRNYTTKIVLHNINSRKLWVLKDIKAYIQLPIEVRRAADDTTHDNIVARLNEQAD